ncbi:hypothetical protein RO3G_03575 [Rhizopus delemar RA 99-880]|uniref:RNA-directed DNA polymerase n=3 Tax=Rhizopus delemar (strain RA 99-880 / ATCC MYA-4621 / FGSC 9543 / NRRL 43880) TaxID=246409 RepID=I1BRP0_RHIO9|nr:hypothetical protein RO3G_03575 [Rhizopus delemar RA 99-880]|eukprot:EIE78870.1 hypothetical protein RO3G_03575 [Rhizopus delemar RA 99-880]
MNSTTGENSFNSGAAPNGDNMSMATGSIDLSSFAGSSPLTDDGTAMVLDSFLVPSSSTGEREELLLRQNLTQLRSEFNGFLEAFTTARLAGDEAAADHALQQMDRTKRRLTAMQEYSSILGKTASPNASISSRNAGLTLSHRDLPKFQLASSVVRPFPNEEVFESVEHFLARFENIIKGSAYRDVEQVWKQFLPLCLPYSDNAWVETDLRKCNTWAEARAAFKEHHGSSLATRHYTDLVFTMQMSNKESIGDYSKKFLQAVYNAGLPSDDPRIADRFLASLTLSVQTLIRVTVARVGKSKADTNEKWTVEYITQVGRDILGDDNKLYAEATALIPGANKSDTVKSRYNENGSRGDGSLSGHRRHQFKRRSHNMTKVNKNYFCTHHGKNGTHDTVDCFTTKRVEKVNTNKKCFKCGQPWSKEHKCKNNDKKVFAVTSHKNDNNPDDDVVKDKTALLDQATSEVNTMMEGLSYDCKYQNKERTLDKKEIKANAFNLLTPIIIENEKLMGLVDTGSDTSFIDINAFTKKLKLNKINKISGSYNFLSHNNDVSRIGITDPLKFKYSNGIMFEHSLEIMKFNTGFDFDVLLGTDILPKMNIGLTGVAFRLSSEHSHSDTATDEIQILENINIDQVNEFEPDNSPAGTAEQRANFFDTIKDVLKRNQSIPVTSSCPMPESIIHLPTKEGATAYRRQYPIPHALRPFLDKQIEEWLKTGTIIKSKVNTSFNSPLLLVPKRNKAGEIVNHRVCLDVRLLNNILPPTFNYPVPLIRDIFDNLNGKKVFSTIDLSNAYHRFKVAPEDVHKLTFTHDNAQYSFIKGCFGVKMLTSQFQKCLAILFDGISCVQNFVDDCIVASDSFEQHAEDVKLVLEKLTSVNLIVNPDKCVWFQHSVRLLGFVVNTTGTKVDRNKLTNVQNWPIPNQSHKHVQQFMGLINYFRDYVPMISRVAEPITRLSNAVNIRELWTDEQTNSFNALKAILQSNLVLHYPDLNKKFFVATDASLYGVAAVLYQKDELQRDKYISFVSSSLTPSQRRWSTTKRELYAIILALKKYRKFLWGKHFTIYSDHKALVYLHTQKIANPMMIGWMETLLDFDFDVVHIPGVLNKLPDQLSRLYPPLEDDNKLVEDSVYKKNKNNLKIKKVVVKRKKYCRDKSINVLATRLIENKNELTDYLTPPEEERDAILRETHSYGHYGYQAIVRDIHSRDLAGPLPATGDDYIYLLVLTDICTKYIVIRPLKNKQSDTVAKELISIFGDYGFPRIIQSDNGTEFRNSLMSHISKNLGIDRRYSTAYHPQGNGSAEASVKIAMNTLRKMIQSNGRDWNHYLPIVQLCINRYIKNKTLSSPFSLMYARRVNMPDDYANKKYPIPNDLMTVEELEERIKHMEEIVFPAILERTQKINEEYSPYTVVRKNRGGSYELKDEQNELLHRNYTPSELKVVNMDESNIENEYYEVEDIRDHRGPIGHREFLVKWAGYGERANTWQKASDFTDPTIIEKYWDKQDELKKLEHERAEHIVNKASSNSKYNESNRNSAPKLSNEKKVHSVETKKRTLPTKLSREERLLKRRLNKEKK